MTPKQFVKFRNRMDHIVRNIEKEVERTQRAVVIPSFANVRPAKASDIVVGACIYYFKDQKFWFWSIISSVKWPDDDFKAYTGDDGCRHGLFNGFVDL